MAAPKLQDPPRPSSPNLPGKRPPGVNPLTEYVAGGSNLWLATYLRSMPFYVDDVTRDFGDDLYDRMLFDTQVKSCLEILIMAVLAGGVHLTPPIEDDTASEFQLASDIQAFCQRNLDRLERPFVTETLHDMCQAFAYGNRVAELVFEQPANGPDAGKLCLKAIKPKPRRSLAFVVDVFYNIVGFIGLRPGQGYTVFTSTYIGDVKDLLPRSKFAVLTFKPHDGNPLGTSLLRAAYNPWWFKQQIYPEYLKYLSVFAGPSIYGITAENAVPYPKTDDNGVPILDPVTGNPTVVDPEAGLLATLIEWRNSTAAAFPFGTEIGTLDVPEADSPFQNAFEYLNGEICKAILNQTLATEQAKHQARAAAVTHQEVMELAITYCRNVLEAFIRNELLIPLVRYNFGEEAVYLAPTVSMTETQEQDFGADATAVAALMTSGYLDPSQFAEIDAFLNLPERSEESIKAAIDRVLNPPEPQPATGSAPPAKGPVKKAA